MCGIFGVLVPQSLNCDRQRARQLFEKLLLLSDSRGKEAAGVADFSQGKLKIVRAPIRGNLLMKEPVFQRLITSAFNCDKTISIIGHSRLETNGTYISNQNNQPVITHHIAGIHNGICVNDDLIWKHVTKASRQTELDSEAVFSYLDEQIEKTRSVEQAIRQLFTLLQGSASLAFFHSQLKQLTLATNTGSIYYSHQKNLPFAFSSEKHILSSALRYADLPTDSIHHLKPGMMAQINLLTAQPRLHSFIKKSAIIRSNSFVKNEQQIELVPFHPVAKTTPIINNPLTQLKQHKIDTTAIKKLKRCTRCILPETMPLISFDEFGVCSYCRQHQPITVMGKEALLQQLEKIRSKNGEPDCILALSGGRDSSYGLHYLIKELNMHPIAYSYDWGMNSPIGRRNQARMVGKLGVEHIIVSADIQQKRKNIRHNILAWLESPNLGMVPLFMAGDKQAEYYAEELRKKTKIKQIFYCRGNELENEEFKWGHCGIRNGSPKGVLHNLSLFGKTQLAFYYLQQFLTNPKYLNASLIDTTFAYFVAYMMPLNFTYLWHYIPWNEEKIVQTLVDEYGWETDTESDVTWRIDDGSVAFYNYIYYRVQGFTENDTFRSNQIREGIMTRKQALDLVHKENKPRYKALKWYFDTLQLDGEMVLNKIDQMPRLY